MNSFAPALAEGLAQKLESEAIANQLYGKDTPERAAYEERLRLYQELGLEGMVRELKRRCR